MLADQSLTSTVSLLGFPIVWQVFAIGIVILAILYFLFSLIVLRQVSLMTEVVITEGSAILRALAILHSGIALAVIVLLVSILY